MFELGWRFGGCKINLLSESFVEILEIVKIVAAVFLLFVWFIPIPPCLFSKDRSDENIVWGISSIWSFVLLGISYLLPS